MSFHETIAANEAARFEQFASEIVAIQRARAAKGGAVARALHLKPHIGAVGELVVEAPESARAGVFANPGQRWPVYARFSNGSSAHQPDKAPDVRGFALKLVGVPGKKIIAGLEQEATQDFLFIDQQAIRIPQPRGVHGVRARGQGRADQAAAAVDRRRSGSAERSGSWVEH